MKKFGQLSIKTTNIYSLRITRVHCGHVHVLKLCCSLGLGTRLRSVLALETMSIEAKI